MDDHELNNFTNYYYQSGTPEKAVEALEHYLSSEVLKKLPDERSMPLAFFFSRVADLTPDIIRSYEALFDQTGFRGRTFLLEVFRQAGDERTRSFLKSQLSSVESDLQLSQAERFALKEELRGVLSGAIPVALDPFNRAIRGAQDLDLLWAEFMVKGHRPAVIRIIEVLDWEDLIRERLLEWLASNALIRIPFLSELRKKRVLDRLRLKAGIDCNLVQKQIVGEEDLDCMCQWERGYVITKALPFSFSPDELMYVLTKGSAKWSLTVNAKAHPIVLEICQEEAERRRGRPRLELLEIVGKPCLLTTTTLPLPIGSRNMWSSIRPALRCKPHLQKPKPRSSSRN